jgi:alpha-glucosidase
VTESRSSRAGPGLRSSPMTDQLPWWRHALVYQVYLRSFADGNGDGTGDIAGLRSRLGYLQALGVDAVWVNPWYASPLNDGGYDVSDYRDCHPLFGTIDEAKQLIDEAAELDLKLLVDLVPNHTSSEHEWFRAAVAAAPGSPKRQRYHFLPGKGHNGQLPPNNWKSVFGGPAWSRLPDGEWYLHLFDATQPDLNWQNQDVRAEFRDILRFWLDLGAAGFRVDVAHALVKAEGYPDTHDDLHHPLEAPHPADHPMWDRPGLHDVVRDWRSVLDEYPDRMMIAEAWVPDWTRLALYVRPDEYHQTFDFHFLMARWEASVLQQTITESLRATGDVGSVPSWVLSNHDVVRHTTRYALPQDVLARDWLLDGDRALLDAHLGLRRARAAALLMLGLPGSAYLYQGEELGLPEVHDLPEGVLQDPVWERSGHTVKGRDGCRVPIPWTKDGDSYGFGDNGSWLPQPTEWSQHSVEAQENDPESTLELYRKAIGIRREVLRHDDHLDWLDFGPEVLAFRRGSGVVCLVNLGDHPVDMPRGDLLVASGPLDEGAVPSDTAVWVMAPD